jgi:hypothetical protein
VKISNQLNQNPYLSLCPKTTESGIDGKQHEAFYYPIIKMLCLAKPFSSPLFTFLVISFMGQMDRNIYENGI